MKNSSLLGFRLAKSIPEPTTAPSHQNVTNNRALWANADGSPMALPTFFVTNCGTHATGTNPPIQDATLDNNTDWK
jgi:hypothetical protein